MGLAHQVATRSKDPSSAVGAGIGRHRPSLVVFFRLQRATARHHMPTLSRTRKTATPQTHPARAARQRKRILFALPRRAWSRTRCSPRIFRARIALR